MIKNKYLLIGLCFFSQTMFCMRRFATTIPVAVGLKQGFKTVINNYENFDPEKILKDLKKYKKLLQKEIHILPYRNEFIESFSVGDAFYIMNFWKKRNNDLYKRKTQYLAIFNNNLRLLQDTINEVEESEVFTEEEKEILLENYERKFNVYYAIDCLQTEIDENIFTIKSFYDDLQKKMVNEETLTA